ncbi:Lrp/AsnC family transcriptional regulator [Paraburkholderia sp. FT54]|uniref:Lrp/AsnC family transcriptional regulator n=1 Tax=Paraburkholderia sp. FT54 TaxID=3074437 RepID=UPI0028774943|nr:Lrp/AsnC family transcriptional regulator [Paraburkholderia sp. FT54]WNC90997.1 Lrp/AsnC family transcriptional regulator [Paraburkholderia sp. FT54]
MSAGPRPPSTRSGKALRAPGAQSGAASLDDTDRKLLALLAEDATRTYAELGKLLFLSAPAVHERARRLKKEGVIKATVAALDAARLNRPLLAFVHVDTTSWAVTRQLLALQELADVEEIHTVTGESAMLLKVRTRDTQSLEQLLARIHAIEGFTGTRSYIALTTYLERGPSPEL